MLNYLYSQVFTKEIPDELSLGFVMTGCNVHCPDCHSKHIWDINCEGLGKPMTIEVLDKTIQQQSWVSCILFFGGEWNAPYLNFLFNYLRKNYDYKLALYSGRDFDFLKKSIVLEQINYVKVGPYISNLGGLDYPSTNQHLYTLKDGAIDEDITHYFWRTNIK
jgi:anaerobic ribonucleoside-triphosphate reductase activating protein